MCFWVCVCVYTRAVCFFRLFDVSLLPPPTSSYKPSQYAPSPRNFCVTGSRSFRRGRLMCAADLICKPISIHGVKLISLRKEGRGRKARRASFYCWVSSGSYCYASLRHSERYRLDRGHTEHSSRNSGEGVVEGAKHHLAQLWDAWLPALGW